MNKAVKPKPQANYTARQAAAADIRSASKPKVKSKAKPRKDLNFRVEALVPAAANRRFERRIAELMKEVRRLAMSAVNNGTFKKVWINKTRVRAHTRQGHWTHRLVTPKPLTTLRKVTQVR